jgi:uncharacterized protein
MCRRYARLEGMIHQDLLEILRCPLNPSNARLALRNGCLECEQCALRFKIKDGFPILVVEEAELPNGCESTSQLPCQCQPMKSV